MNSTDSGSPIDLLLVGGIAAILFSVFGFIVNRRRYQRWVKTSGTIIEAIKVERISPDRPNMPTYSPKVSFRTATGESVEFVSEVSSYPPPVVGSIVPVLYDPNDPKEAELDRFMSKYLLVVVAFFGGIVMVGIYLIEKFGS